MSDLKASNNDHDWVGFLTDAELNKGVSQGWIESCRSDVTFSWEGAVSQIQPSSIDLYPEGFFTPDSSNKDELKSVDLPAGGAVVYYTKEKLALPPDVMGFVFTPTHLSMKAFFSPSIGHIDPGFKGALKLVGINMGRNPLHLDADTKVATVVLCKLHAKSTRDYTGRNGAPDKNAAVEKAREIASRFATDFGNFREQAKNVAQSESRALQTEVETKLAGLRGNVDTKLAGALSSVDTKLTGTLSSVDTKVETKASELQKSLSDVQKSWWLPLVLALVLIPAVQILSNYLTGIDDLKQRLAKLEGAVASARLSLPTGSPAPK
jgi:deoxycytidine triphosphate deaminase